SPPPAPAGGRRRPVPSPARLGWLRGGPGGAGGLATAARGGVVAGAGTGGDRGDAPGSVPAGAVGPGVEPAPLSVYTRGQRTVRTLHEALARPAPGPAPGRPALVAAWPAGALAGRRADRRPGPRRAGAGGGRPRALPGHRQRHLD